jgi:glycosyltransferase involved in cell wall biosynthesis
MSTSGEPFLSIVIPAYNEVRRLEASIRALREYLHAAPWSHEVVVVVELSTDGTLDMARRLTDGVPGFGVLGHDVHRGKGHAVRGGMRRARGEIAFFMDADLSTPLAEVDRFLARFAQPPPVDVLVGNRRHGRSAITRRQPFLRRQTGRIFNALLRAIAGIRVADTQCGFKAFRRAAREAIFAVQKIDGFAFDAEVLLLAEELGFRVEDMPVEWRDAEGSKIHLVRDAIRMLRDALRIRRLVAESIASAGQVRVGRGDPSQPG